MNKAGIVLALAILGCQVLAEEEKELTPREIILQEYLGILEIWSRDTTFDVETRLTQWDLDTYHQRCIRGVHEHVRNRLAQHDPETLLPLATLYFQTFMHQIAERPGPNVPEARYRFDQAMRSHVVRAQPRDEARQTYALAQTYFSIKLLQKNELGLAYMALDATMNALSMVPKDPLLLYWAGFLNEKLGNHTEARRLFRRLMKTHGDEPEIRLRYGVNLLRRYHWREGRAALEQVARGPHDKAWRILAYQELAQIHPQAGHPDALAVLDEALKLFPNDPGLRLLANFHGRRVDPVSEPPPSNSIPPRMRYEMHRSDQLNAAAAAFQDAVNQRRPNLAAALAALQVEIMMEPNPLKGLSHCDKVAPLADDPGG